MVSKQFVLRFGVACLLVLMVGLLQNRASTDVLAAEAARETSNLVDGTVITIKDGYALVSTTAQVFSEVIANDNKVATFMNEIASASREQTNGIRQIDEAVTELDRGTQQNAATAQQLSASTGYFKVH